MISRHSIIVVTFGWLIVFAYLYYDYSNNKNDLLRHFSSSKPADIILHLIIISALIGSHITGYLINDRNKLLIKTKKAKDQLRQAAHEWMSTFDSMPYGVMLTDTDRNIIRANKYIVNLSGVPVKELVSGKKSCDIICKQQNPLMECLSVQSLNARQTKTYEYQNNDKRKTYNESVSPMFDDKGKIISFVHVLSDVTDATEKEKKLSHSKDAFFNMLKDVDSAYKELKEIHDSLIITFSNIIDAKSSWTRGHSIDVANYAAAIAREMGLDERELDTLRIAALLHDIGKIGTYDVILDKPDELNIMERTLIKEHTIKGEAILRPIKGFKNIIPIVRSHHERIDGSGYPDGLRGDQIHPLARILCVADSFDAMISDRPYRLSQGRDFAMSELRRCAGTQFDSRVTEAFLNILGRSSDNIPTA